MKLKITLALLLSSLYFNNVYALSADMAACNLALESGDVAAAMTLATKALTQNKNDKEALICQGRAYSAKGDLAPALAALQLAAKQTTDALDQSIIALVTGNAYKAAKQHDSATASYEKSLAYAQTANNPTFARISQNLMADIKFDNKQFAPALTLYMAGSKLAANDNERGESFEKIALTQHKLKQHDAAVEYQIKAYMMHEKVGTLDQFAHSSIMLGRYYSLAKNYISATNILNKIIKFAKEQGGAYYEAQASYVLAQVKVASGDIPAAKALIAQANLIAKTSGDQLLTDEIKQETADLF
jgi:tetratricopeptide (TPR) repeat protein